MDKTRSVSQNEITQNWYIIDAEGHRVGRLATLISQYLLGKNNPLSRDYLAPQNKVIVLNAEKMDVTPKRAQTKYYTSYSGYPGGIEYRLLADMMVKFPERVLEKAIRGMLPKNSRGRAIMAGNLFVYRDGEHKHEAQQPVTIDVKTAKI